MGAVLAGMAVGSAVVISVLTLKRILGKKGPKKLESIVNEEFFKDPAMDPAFKEAWAKLLQASAPIVEEIKKLGKLASDDSLEGILKRCTIIHNHGHLGNEILAKGYEKMDGVRKSSVEVKGYDGHMIPCNIYVPDSKEPTEDLNTILYFHGGGMACFSHETGWVVGIGKAFARKNMRAICVGFRNSIEKPFPAGLNDCYAVTKWAAKEFKAPVIVFGESGGGNLAIATCLKAMKEGTYVEIISGCYSCCPMIEGKYPNKYPSSVKYSGYFINNKSLEEKARLYTRDKEEKGHNAILAWPSKASVEDLKGFPPTVIRLQELDPLRDEGIAFYHKLLQAKVNVRSLTIGGTMHAGDTFCALKEHFTGLIDDVVSFAKRRFSPSTL